MKLYSFSKNSWHVEFFKWLFNEDPTQRYKTMCPYFWTYVLILLFLPLILIIKLFGNGGTKFLAWVKDYKENKRLKSIEYLKTICSNPNITQAEAYKIVRSKCWDNYRFYLDYDVETNIKELWLEEYYRLEDIEVQESAKRYAKQQERKREMEKFSSKVEEYREYAIVKYLSYLFIGAFAVAVLYGFYSLIMLIPFASVPWGDVGFYVLVTIMILVTAGATIGLFYLLVIYVLKPFFQWVSCVKLPKCGVCENIRSWFGWLSYFSYAKYIVLPFWWLILGIGKMFVIIGHMIYSTYKKSCPIIEWKE